MGWGHHHRLCAHPMDAYHILRPSPPPQPAAAARRLGTVPATRKPRRHLHSPWPHASARASTVGTRNHKKKKHEQGGRGALSHSPPHHHHPPGGWRCVCGSACVAATDRSGPSACTRTHPARGAVNVSKAGGWEWSPPSVTAGAAGAGASSRPDNIQGAGLVPHGSGTEWRGITHLPRPLAPTATHLPHPPPPALATRRWLSGGEGQEEGGRSQVGVRGPRGGRGPLLGTKPACHRSCSQPGEEMRRQRQRTSREGGTVAGTGRGERGRERPPARSP